MFQQGGLQIGPTTGNVSDTSSGGGGGGLSQSQVQALIDTSLTGAVQPSSVTVSGGGQVKANGGFNFDTSTVPDGQESSIEREGNGGMILKRGSTNFLTLSPFTGATFGVNVTAANLTVNGTLALSGTVSGMYTSSQTDTLLATKQSVIADGGLAQVKVTNLTTDLATLTSNLAAKQDALTSSSSVAVGTLTAATEVVASTIKAPTSSSVLLGNSAGTGLTVASNGAIGVLKSSPNEALDVFGSAAISGSLDIGSSANPWEIFEDANGDLYIKKGTQHFLGFGASSNPNTIYFLVATASYSDKRLKNDIEDLPDEDCLSLLKSVSAKSYVRNDLVGSERRCGFIAQDVEAAAASSLGSNLVGDASRGIDGTPDTIKTLSYERMSVVLWQRTRSLLARLESLEAAVAP